MSDDVKPWNLFDGSPRSSEELSQYRLDICKGCEWFGPKMQRCKKCGCFMVAKTLLLDAHCPVDKW
jgi:hypothetical protein